MNNIKYALKEKTIRDKIVLLQEKYQKCYRIMNDKKRKRKQKRITLKLKKLNYRIELDKLKRKWEQ